MARFDLIGFRVVLAEGQDTIASLRFLTEALNGIVSAAVWGSLAHTESNDPWVHRTRELLHSYVRDPKASRRLFPGFDHSLGDNFVFQILDEQAFEPTDPMDSATRYALDSWFLRMLQKRDPALYREIFAFARLDRVEHHSPLAIELSLIIGAATLVPVLLTYTLMRTITDARRRVAEARIREAEAGIKEEELRHVQIQTRILETVAVAAEELAAHDIPKDAITAAAKVGTSSVADLASSPLIGSVTLGMSTKPS
jgi:hypothetical protein